MASIAAGGSLSSSHAVQAFGFALQETVAIRLPQVVCSIPDAYSDLVLLLMSDVIEPDPKGQYLYEKPVMRASTCLKFTHRPLERK